MIRYAPPTTLPTRSSDGALAARAAARRHLARRHFLALGVAFAIGAAGLPAVAPAAAAGEMAPDFTLPTAQGELSLSALRGQVIYLDFWASWCTPCRKSFPWLNAMQTKYAERGFTVLSVNVDAEAALAARFLAELPAQFPVAYDPAGEVAARYRVMGMPSAYLIDRDGRIHSSHIGFRDDGKAGYEEAIRALLAQ